MDISEDGARRRRRVSGGGGPSLFITATGGTITTDGDYKVHTFNTSSTLEVTSAGAAPNDGCWYLSIAGGGGAGRSVYGTGGTGGGGAGGYRTTGLYDYIVTVGSKTVTVGAGGALPLTRRLRRAPSSEMSISRDWHRGW